MKRLYEPLAYGPEPRRACYWNTTIPPLERAQLKGTHNTDIAIIGAGYTGLNAALRLAQNGAHVTVLEAETIGWGASGRSGGFCCLGGSILSNRQMDRKFGEPARRDWHQAEIAAIDHVETLLKTHNIDADRHSRGETLLAHSAKHWPDLQRQAEEAANDYATDPELIPATELANHGLAGPFHGALTLPIGFALNPLKYTLGIAQAALDSGAQIYQSSPVHRIEKGTGFTIHTDHGRLTAKQLIIATNGYSSEDVPPWLAARFMPVQSTILVTRPLTDAEIAASGWSSDQMALDNRNLLHYFRLMPDRRFLFGMRGGIFASARSDAKIKNLIRADFETMFPAWANIETEHHWSGLICMTAKRTPYTGPIPEMPGAYASLGYHGNGVSMGSYCGALLADQILGKATESGKSKILQHALPKMPLGRKRRWLLPPLYSALSLADRL